MNDIAQACLQAEIQAVKHYINSLRCQDYARECDDENGKKIYRQGAIKHKTMALIAYDRAITGRPPAFP